MVKQKQKLSPVRRTPLQNKKKIALYFIVPIFLIAAVIFGLTYGYIFYVQYKAVLNHTELTKMQSLVFTAAEAIKTDAPVDPKTGDIYFPQAKMYLPTPGDSLHQKLLYSYYPGSDVSEKEFSITSQQALNIVKSRTISTSYTITEFFEQVPHFQACTRGIEVSETQLPKDETMGSLKKTLTLNDGRTIYLYADDRCHELSGLLTALEGLRAY